MSNTYVPAEVRKELWVLSGGRCQFRGCNMPVDRNFLTGQRVMLAEHCHIVGDSAKGPRGDDERSTLLAKHPANLILCCAKCHKTIDESVLASEYTEAQLLSMKHDHEQHIQRLYNATDVKRSVPFIVTGRINKTPTAIPVDIARAAVLRKTNYTRFPSHEEEIIDLNNIPCQEDDPIYWTLVKQHISDTINSILRRVTDRNIHHLDMFATAQIPALAYIGALIGDRLPVTIHQPQREPLDKWDWPANPKEPTPTFRYNLPEVSTNELVIIFSISGVVKTEDVERVLPGIPLAIFTTQEPSTSLADSQAALDAFVNSWRDFQNTIHQQYGRLDKLHVFPALPVSYAVELGRCVLPKVIPEIQIWDYVRGSFIKAISW